MPVKISPYRITVLDDEERERIAEAARLAGLSVSNWFREQAGLPPVEHGGAREHCGHAKDRRKRPKTPRDVSPA